jgi:3-hydroxyisobutyrate dehydrogenase
VSAIETIAFIGLGNMGTPMSEHVGRYAAEHRIGLRVFDLDTERTVACAKIAGAHAAASTGEAARDADVLILMLPDAKAVSSLLFTDGVAEALKPGAIVVDMGSSYPLTTRETGARMAASSRTMLDAPVSGGVRRAADASLTIMLGGDDGAAISAVEPVLSCMGTTYRTGRLGSGHALKALNNYVSAAGLRAASEALHVGQAFGLDPATMVDVFNVSTGRNNATEVKFHQHILSGTFGSGFAMALMAKDLGAAADMSDDLGAPAAGVVAEAALWREALEALGPDADHTEIYRHLLERQAPGNSRSHGTEGEPKA